jgi:hypothetical protein
LHSLSKQRPELKVIVAAYGRGFKPPQYLTAGDVVRVEIDGIGVFENPLIQRPTAASVRLKRHEKKAVTVR